MYLFNRPSPKYCTDYKSSDDDNCILPETDKSSVIESKINVSEADILEIYYIKQRAPVTVKTP